MKEVEQEDGQASRQTKARSPLIQWAVRVVRGLALLTAVAAGVLTVASAGDKGVWPVCLFFATICLLCLWFAFQGHIPRQRVLMLFSVASGVLLGLPALYFGMIWAHNRWPESNIAPIVGYIFSGPIGFSLGAVLGITLGLFFQHRKDKKQSNKALEATADPPSS